LTRCSCRGSAGWRPSRSSSVMQKSPNETLRP
jgi:hypothetical protein